MFSHKSSGGQQNALKYGLFVINPNSSSLGGLAWLGIALVNTEHPKEAVVAGSNPARGSNESFKSRKIPTIVFGETDVNLPF